MQDLQPSPGSGGKSLRGWAIQPLTRPSWQARVLAAWRRADVAGCDCAHWQPGECGATPASNQGAPPPTPPAPGPDSRDTRDRPAAAPVASAGGAHPGRPVPGSRPAGVSVGGDGRAGRSPRTACCSWTGLVGGNHPSSVGHLSQPLQIRGRCRHRERGGRQVNLLGQFREQEMGQFR